MSRPRLPFENHYKIEDRGYSSPCWIWQGAVTTNGYGQFSRYRKTTRAHRYYYEKNNGKIPHGMEIHHLCQTKLCVNATHMKIVTREDHNRITFSKLTDDDINTIRELCRNGNPQTEVAKLYNIDHNTVHNIVYKIRWK
jgi:hypothetical protein